MRIDFAPSASRHRISRERIRHVVEHCASPLHPPDDDPAHGDRVMFLGPDAHAVPLEIVAIETADGGLCVIHAVRLRRTYGDDDERVTGHRP